jgi:hypothetical protein
MPILTVLLLLLLLLLLMWRLILILLDRLLACVCIRCGYGELGNLERIGVLSA